MSKLDSLVVLNYVINILLIILLMQVATVGLTITIPLAMTSDVLVYAIIPTVWSILGAVLVTIGFCVININSNGDGTSADTIQAPTESVSDRVDEYNPKYNIAVSSQLQGSLGDNKDDLMAASCKLVDVGNESVAMTSSPLYSLHSSTSPQHSTLKQSEDII